METDGQSIPVTLQIHHDGSQMTLNIPTTTKISQLKNMTCERMGIPVDLCEIIFCGHVMKDNYSLETYDVSPATTLHFVPKERHHHKLKESIATSKVCYLTGIWMHRLLDTPMSLLTYQTHNEVDTSWPMFYAYCKQCAGVVSSKLRVRCQVCKQDTVTLNRDPKGWVDVISPNQILGCCNSVECTGNLCHADFYFKCTICCDQSHVIPLPNVTSNCNKSLCLTCLEFEHPVVAFPCRDDHVTCLSCFEQYARTNLRERTMVCDQEVGYTLRCPDGCVNSCLMDTHIFHILGPDEYQVYQSYAAEECLLLNMPGLFCPNPQCGTGLFSLNEHQIRQKIEAQCPTCKHKFCPICKEAYHGLTLCGRPTYNTGSANSQVVREYFASIHTIGQISKKCPKCLTSTERNGGCMHMTCRVCHFEWCWHCVEAWGSNCQMDHWFG